MNSLKLLQWGRRSLRLESRNLSFISFHRPAVYPKRFLAQTQKQIHTRSKLIFSQDSSRSIHATGLRFAFSKVERSEEFCISADDLKSAVDKDNVQVIDVRKPDEVNAGRISAKKFIHIPVQEVADALQLSDEDFKNKYGVDKPSKDAPDIVFHCHAGGRSTVALRIAQGLGYTRAKHYPGGWSEWSERKDE